MKSSGNIEQACAILASDDCRGQSLIHLIMETLKAPRTVSFQLLLSMPRIKELQTHPDMNQYYHLIELFAFGSYSDYQAASESVYPPLSLEHIRKLKMLSLLTLAAKSQTLLYDDLLDALDISNITDLERLVIDCIYEASMDAKLDQANRSVRIMRVDARDVHINQKPEMIFCLQTWLKSCEDYKVQLESLADEIDGYVKTRTEQEQAVLSTVEAAKTELPRMLQQQTVLLPLGGRVLAELNDNDIDMIDELGRASSIESAR